MFSMFKKKQDNTAPTHTKENEANTDSNTVSASTVSEKGSWLQRLKKGLAKTGSGLSHLFSSRKIDDDLFEEIETALLMADVGMPATESILKKLSSRVKEENITDSETVKRALADILTEHLKVLEKDFLFHQTPLVMMIAGINGAGKTTTIGKLAFRFKNEHKKILLAAGDTFRAAAQEQLRVWGERNEISVISQEKGDPASVAYDAVISGTSKGYDLVMIDTAGRLPTQLHLMEEIKKIKRVVTKASETAPHEVLLVIDGNNGQNALAQIKAFDEAIGLTGLVITKLDGTAKGGVIAAIAHGTGGVRPIPVYWIGVGEQVEDLQPFCAKEFAYSLFGLDI